MIAVTINDCDDWRDHAALYAYGFSLYGTRTVLQKGAYAAELTLMDGSRAALTAGQDFACFLRKEEAVTVRVSYPRCAFCAGTPGTPAGFGSVWIGETCVGTIPLLWGEET